MIAINDAKYDYALKILDIRLDEQGWPHVYRNNMGRELHPEVVRKGYPQLHVNIDGKWLFLLLHRLVAMKYVANDDPVNKRLVDHINADKMDCRPSNLRWVTDRENKRNPHNRARQSRVMKEVWKEPGFKEKMAAIRRRTMASADVRVKISKTVKETLTDPLVKLRNEVAHQHLKKSVEQIDLKANVVVAIFDSIKQASRMTGIGHIHISHVCRGKYKSAGGFGWRFKSPPGVTNNEQVRQNFKVRKI